MKNIICIIFTLFYLPVFSQEDIKETAIEKIEAHSQDSIENANYSFSSLFKTNEKEVLLDKITCFVADPRTNNTLNLHFNLSEL